MAGNRGCCPLAHSWVSAQGYHAEASYHRRFAHMLIELGQQFHIAETEADTTHPTQKLMGIRLMNRFIVVEFQLVGTDQLYGNLARGHGVMVVSLIESKSAGISNQHRHRRRG